MEWKCQLLLITGVNDVFITKQDSLESKQKQMLYLNWYVVDVQLFGCCPFFFESLYDTGLMRPDVSVCSDVFESVAH